MNLSNLLMIAYLGRDRVGTETQVVSLQRPHAYVNEVKEHQPMPFSGDRHEQPIRNITQYTKSCTTAVI